MRRWVAVALLCCAWLAVPIAQVDVNGRWRVTIGDGDNALVGVASLERKGDKVSGSMGPTEADTTPVSGVLNGDRLTLKTHPKPGFAVPFDTCELVVSGDRMIGSIPMDRGKTQIELVRTPPKK